MLTFYFDRQDPKSAEAVFEWAIPNSDERLVCLEALAGAIKYVHDIAPAAWSITLFAEGTVGLRLNVGQVETFVLRPDGVSLFLGYLFDGLDQMPDIEVLPSEFQSIVGEQWHVWFPSKHFADFLPRASGAHLDFIKKAAITRNGSPRKGTPFISSFSAAVPKYLSQVLSVPLYLPSWYGSVSVSQEVAEESERGTFEIEQVGVGFGLAENNRLVEEKAVLVVKNELEQSGWFVESVERLNVGYDLLCKRDDEELHVEVKGISGSLVAFIITPNELRSARSDKDFVLYAVTKALTENPVINIFSGKDIEEKFKLEPTAFRAVYTPELDGVQML